MLFNFFYKNRVFPNDMKKYQILLLTARGMQWEIQRTPHIYQILLGCTVYNVHSFTFWIQVMNWWINKTILLYVSIVIRGCQIVGLFQSSLNFENFIDQLVEIHISKGKLFQLNHTHLSSLRDFVLKKKS